MKIPLYHLGGSLITHNEAHCTEGVENSVVKVSDVLAWIDEAVAHEESGDPDPVSVAVIGALLDLRAALTATRKGRK